MTYNQAAAALREFEKEENVIAGVVAAAEFYDFPPRVVLPSKITPSRYLESFKTIFVIGVGNGKRFNFAPDGKKRVRLNQGSIGRDYHITVAETLERLAAALKIEVGGFDYKIHVDAGPLPERLIAVKAGLGFVGKNQCLITRKFGSLLNLGLLVTDFETADIPAVKQQGNCGNCTICAKVCPGGAITDGGFNVERCTPYITRKKGELTDDEKRIIKGLLYGCDACLDECPHNRNKKAAEITDINEAFPEVEYILNLTQEEFEDKYRETSLYWRGLEVLRRNAEI